MAPTVSLYQLHLHVYWSKQPMVFRRLTWLLFFWVALAKFWSSGGRKIAVGGFRTLNADHSVQFMNISTFGNVGPISSGGGGIAAIVGLRYLNC